MIVLDTHVLLWMDGNNPALGTASRQIIETAWRQGQVAVSAISFWEVAQLAQRGRISLPLSLEIWRTDWLQAGLLEIPVDGRIALLSTQLDLPHRDPADRMIAATATQRHAQLLTADQKILGWENALPRQDARA
jgi:PIN domain nuclease of toxin-antitoxin system